MRLRQAPYTSPRELNVGRGLVVWRQRGYECRFYFDVSKSSTVVRLSGGPWSDRFHGRRRPPKPSPFTMSDLEVPVADLLCIQTRIVWQNFEPPDAWR
jgi:hypothetical protein